MGLKISPLAAGSLALALLGGNAALAAPKLRLSNTAVGPVSIAVGQNGPQQVVEAFNAGDGALNLSLSASDPWVVPTLGAARPCTSRQGTCLPINIALTTASLPRGAATATLVVADANAVDAPQTITVTVRMGGAVPDRIDLTVPPFGSDSVGFESARLTYSVGTQTGGGWLSVAMDGGGSFDFVVPYRVTARHINALPEGVYNGNVNITGSSFPPDVKNIPVTMRVTTQPIATVSPETLEAVLPQDSPAAERTVTLGNRGLGTLALAGVAAAAEGGGTWLAAEVIAGTTAVKVTLNPAGLTPGRYTGEVTIQSNASVGPAKVPVRLTVEAKGPPVVSPGGVVSNATFSSSDPVAQGDILAVFGRQLSYQSLVTGTAVPLVTELGGAKVLVNGREAPLFFASSNQVIGTDQINFQLPYETAPGEALVQVVRDGQTSNTVSVQVVARNPRILTFFGNYAIAVNLDGTFPIPVTPGIASRPAKAGDVLVIYAIGFGGSTPPVATGAGAPGTPPFAEVNPRPMAHLGGGILPIPATPQFVGLTPGFVGLWQINLPIPANAPKGDRIPLYLDSPGYQTNVVDIAIQ